MAEKLKIIPLGGLDEIGKNITVLEYGRDMIVVDCGVGFPEEDMYGVDLVIPDFSYLVANQKKLRGMFITHGHVFNEQNRPALAHDIFVYGHTHLWKLEPAENDGIVCNLGSITFPKGGNEPTFATYDDGKMRIRRMDGSIIKELF